MSRLKQIVFSVVLSEKKNRLYLICIFYSLKFVFVFVFLIMHGGQAASEPVETETAVTKNGATRNDKTRYISIKSDIFQS